MKATATSHVKKLIALAAASLAVTAQAQLIDNFSVAGLGDYTLTRILDNGVAEANVSFSDASGALVATYGGTVSQPEQVVLLRSDFSLAVGSVLRLDVSFATQPSTMDFGLAVSSTATPTGSSVGATDTRTNFNWAAVYVRPSQDVVRNTTANNGVLISATGISNAVETTVSQLYIGAIQAPISLLDSTTPVRSVMTFAPSRSAPLTSEPRSASTGISGLSEEASAVLITCAWRLFPNPPLSPFWVWADWHAFFGCAAGIKRQVVS